MAGVEEKLPKVTSWLKKIFGDQSITPYEVNVRTIDILYELAKCNERRDSDVSLLIDDMKQKAVEYESDGNYLRDLLTESLSLSFSSQSELSTAFLNHLVDTAVALETKDTSLACFISAINDLTSDLYAAESKNKDMELELNNLRRKLTSALVLEKRLQEGNVCLMVRKIQYLKDNHKEEGQDLFSIIQECMRLFVTAIFSDLMKTEELLVTEKAKADSRNQNMTFLKDKSEDIKFRIKSAEEQLSASGLDASLTHESLVNLSEKLAEIKKQAVPLKKKLESYLDLTPNPSLARVKIEEAKRELEALEAEFTAKVDMMACSVTLPTKRQFT